MRVVSEIALAMFISFVPAAFAEESKATTATEEAVAAKCEHGVKKSVCTRCNPKLAAVFKAKNDWCAEHERPESQCVLCNPALKEQGVKP
jgi:hypothetical protein